jgi:hypothetical protein
MKSLTLLPYAHFTPSYLITTDNSPTADNINVITTDEDVPIPNLDYVANHRAYFNNISACTNATFVPTTVAQFENSEGFPSFDNTPLTG